MQYDKAIQINPKESDFYNNKGIALDYLGKYNDAIVQYDLAIQNNPKLAISYYNKGIALKNLG